MSNAWTGHRLKASPDNCRRWGLSIEGLGGVVTPMHANPNQRAQSKRQILPEPSVVESAAPGKWPSRKVSSDIPDPASL